MANYDTIIFEINLVGVRSDMTSAELVDYTGRFQPVVEADATIAELQEREQPEDPIEKEQLALDCRRVEAERKKSFWEAMEQLVEAEDLNPAHRNLAVALLGADLHRWPIAERDGLIGEAFRMYDDISDNYDRVGHITLVEDADGGEVGLYRNNGISVKKPYIFDRGGEKPSVRDTGIRLQLEEGVVVSINDVGEDSFPEIQITTAARNDLYIFEGVTNFSKPVELLENWREWPFVPAHVLGTREEPDEFEIGHINDQKEDRRRFGVRLASRLMGEDDWMKFKKPSQEFKRKFEETFGRVFADILSGRVPVDKIVHTYGSHSEFMARTYVKSETLRENSLADFPAEQLHAMLYASGASLGSLRQATEACLAADRSSETPLAIYAGMRAAQDIDSFFALLAEPKAS